MREKTKSSALVSVLIVAGLELLLGPILLYVLKAEGVILYSATQASRYPVQLLSQWGLLCIYPAVLFLLIWKRRNWSFRKDMYLERPNKKQWRIIGGLLAVLAFLAAAAVVRTGDPLLVGMNLFYYLVVVAFAEEFILRGLCPYILRNFSMPVVYLLPSVLYALMHLFAYSSFEGVDLAYLGYFLTHHFLGLVFSGICFQIAKEYTRSLWTPILLHAVLDFSILLNI